MNENERMRWLGIFLKVLGIGFLVSFIPWITLIILNVPIISEGGLLAPLLRFQPYNVHYESMMAAIHIAWAFILLRASKDPAQHPLFIDFTIWANAAHGAVMVVVTHIQKGLLMTFVEAGPLLLIVTVLWWLRPRK